MSENQSKNRINLIYILSNGRSGSTILDMLLGACYNAWTMGELFLLPYQYRTRYLPCGCGDDLSECKFWSPFIDNIFKSQSADLEKAFIFRNEAAKGKVLRYKYLSQIRNKSIDPKILKEAETYGRANKNIIGLIKQKARQSQHVDYLIDASKDPYRLLLLHLSGEFNIKVIHLTKSPSGFTYSMTKPEFKILKSVRMSGRWTVENYIMHKLYTKHFKGSEYIHIKYKELASHPVSTLENINDTLKLNLDFNPCQDFISGRSHGIAGNLARFQSKQITADFAYKTKFPKVNNFFTNAICSPMTKKLNY